MFYCPLLCTLLFIPSYSPSCALLLFCCRYLVGVHFSFSYLGIGHLGVVVGGWYYFISSISSLSHIISSRISPFVGVRVSNLSCWVSRLMGSILGSSTYPSKRSIFCALAFCGGCMGWGEVLVGIGDGCFLRGGGLVFGWCVG